MEKLVIFGTGYYGKEALYRYGKNNTLCFCDNNCDIVGEMIEGLSVVSFKRLKELVTSHEDIIVVVSPSDDFVRQEIICQLEYNGITRFVVYHHDDSNYLYNRIIYQNQNINKRKQMIDLLDEISEFDLIESVGEYLDLKNKIVDIYGENGLVIKYDYNDESCFYGNLQAIQEFAGVSQDDELYSPYVIHNNMYPVFTPCLLNKYATIVSGEYYKDKIHSVNPYLPVFSIGPYIHYAEEFIGEKEKQEIKKKYGSIITVVLPHGEEINKNNFEFKKIINYVREKCGRRFDSIWVLAYWYDIDEKLLSAANDEDVLVVTAGVRMDPLFIKRLKSIIMLSDAIMDSITSTTTSYAIAINKQIELLYLDDRFDKLATPPSIWDMMDKYYLGNDVKEFWEQAKKYKLNCNEIELLKNWWEPCIGFKQIKTKEYIKNIFDISKKIWLIAEGNLRYYTESVRKTYKYFEMRNEFEKMLMLKESVGKYIE